MNRPDLATDLLQETAKISWRELQRFFASGHAIAVDESLNLLDVATHIAEDHAPEIKRWIDANLVNPVSDQQALAWYNNNEQVWALVIKPWVLVQKIK